jgi:hypothetical protein
MMRGHRLNGRQQKMTLDFRVVRYNIDHPSGEDIKIKRIGPPFAENKSGDDAPFPSNLRNAWAAINGFEFVFRDDNRPLFVAALSAIPTVVSNTNRLELDVDWRLSDRNGDDHVTGFITVLLIVDRV